MMMNGSFYFWLMIDVTQYSLLSNRLIVGIYSIETRAKQGDNSPCHLPAAWDVRRNGVMYRQLVPFSITAFSIAIILFARRVVKPNQVFEMNSVMRPATMITNIRRFVSPVDFIQQKPPTLCEHLMVWLGLPALSKAPNLNSNISPLCYWCYRCMTLELRMRLTQLL